MGCCGSRHTSEEKEGLTAQLSKKTTNRFYTIKDKFHTLDEVSQALRTHGLESSNLVVGVDFTKSNLWNGKRTFGGRSLHHLTPGALNPYQEVIDIIGRSLETFDDDKLIPAFGFGDTRTTDKGIFPFNPDRPCLGVTEVMQRYTEIAPLVVLSGPTSFAPLIRGAIGIVQATKSYHILLIIADGEVTNVRDTQNAIVEASSYPLSIIMIGVGDGPWELMEEFDDGLPQRRFDNFQFVNYNKVMAKAENREVDFAIAALQEIPEQFLMIRKLNLL